MIIETLVNGIHIYQKVSKQRLLLLTSSLSSIIHQLHIPPSSSFHPSSHHPPPPPPLELSKGKIKMKAVDDEEEKGEELLASCGSLVLGHQINHVALLLSACLTTFGAYFAKDILSAESIHVSRGSRP